MTLKNTMPKSPLPGFWKKTNIPAGQATGVAMDIVGKTNNYFVFQRKGSLVAVVIELTAAVTANFIRFEITKNGSATGKTFDMTSTEDTEAIWEFEPGVLVGNKGDKLGFLWGSHASLTPDGTIEAVIYPEVQWA